MGKSVRRFLLGVALACVSIVLIGCGASSTNSSGSTGDDSNGKRKLIVGTDATYAPMEYMDSNGNIVGIDIRL